MYPRQANPPPPPQGLTGTWVQANGGKGGRAQSWETAADVKNERSLKMNSYGWVGGRNEGGKSYQEKVRQKRWGGRSRLKV